ncbi:hypothetical protein PAMP_008645 [Pampus punctatissimus]
MSGIWYHESGDCLSEHLKVTRGGSEGCQEVESRGCGGNGEEKSRSGNQAITTTRFGERKDGNSSRMRRHSRRPRPKRSPAFQNYGSQKQNYRTTVGSIIKRPTPRKWS